MPKYSLRARLRSMNFTQLEKTVRIKRFLWINFQFMMLSQKLTLYSYFPEGILGNIYYQRSLHDRM